MGSRGFLELHDRSRPDDCRLDDIIGKWRKDCHDQFVCDNCHGHGRVVDPDEYMDPVEGYKFAKRIDCPDCSGEGIVSFDKVYLDSLNQYQARQSQLKQWEADRALIESALSKLTDDEIKAILKTF